MDLFKKLQVEIAVKEMWGVLDEQIKVYQLTSKLLKEFHKSLIKEGFTEEQAMQLVSSFGIQGGLPNAENKA